MTGPTMRGRRQLLRRAFRFRVSKNQGWRVPLKRRGEPAGPPSWSASVSWKFEDGAQPSRHSYDVLRRVVQSYWLTEAAPPPAETRGSIPLEQRSDCQIARVPAHAGRPRAFLKLFRRDESLCNELMGLRVGLSVVQNNHVGVPEILSVASVDNALLLEYVDGKTLASELRWSLLNPWKGGSYHRVWDYLGVWLRAFHHAHPAPDAPNDFMVQQIRQIESRLDDLSQFLDPRLREKLDRLRRILQVRGEGVGPPVVLCHGDFALNNLLVTPDRIWVTDFAYLRFAPREYDLECLWDSLDDVMGSLPRTEHLRATIRQRFVASYGDYAEDPVVADVVHLGLKLQKLYFLRRHVPSSSIRHAWQAYLFGRTIRGLERWATARLDGYET